MLLPRLQDDLLKDFKDQKRVLIEQIELIDPLAKSLRQPAAYRLAGKFLLLSTEIFCYLIAIGLFAATIALNLFYPFNQLSRIRYLHNPSDLNLLQDAEVLSIAVHTLVAILGLFFLVIARMTRRIRLKNKVLFLAGKNMKLLVGQHLERKALMEVIEQRHCLDLPSFAGPAAVEQFMQSQQASTETLQTGASL